MSAARVSLAAALGLVGGLLMVPSAVGESQGSVGASSAAVVADATPASTVSANRRSVSARPTSMVVKGRTKKKRAVVRIKGWSKKRKKWVRLEKVRSKRHKYKTRVSLKGVGKRKLKVKRQGQKTLKVRIPVIESVPPPTSTSTPMPAPSTPCGGSLPKADGTMWTCTFSDEFEGTELDRTKWLPQTKHFENDVCYRDSPETIAVRNGVLRLRVVRGADRTCDDRKAQSSEFSGGSVSTYRYDLNSRDYGFSQKYGRFEARTRSMETDVVGLHEAFWLWPDANVVDVTKWPASGEIDVSETYAHHPDLSIPFLHTALDIEAYTDLLMQAIGIQGIYNILLSGQIPWDLAHSAIANTAWNCEAHRGEWNTYRLEWAADKIEIFVNDKLCLRNTSGDPAFKQPYIVAFTQLLGIGDNRYTDDTPSPATYKVDYIRVWK